MPLLTFDFSSLLAAFVLPCTIVIFAQRALHITTLTPVSNCIATSSHPVVTRRISFSQSLLAAFHPLVACSISFECNNSDFFLCYMCNSTLGDRKGGGKMESTLLGFPQASSGQKSTCCRLTERGSRRDKKRERFCHLRAEPTRRRTTGKNDDEACGI